jgi:hypothetical protein
MGDLVARGADHVSWFKRARRRGSRIARLVRALGVAVVLLFGLYVAGINFAFATPLFGKIVNGSPLSLDVHYARGWSIWPGRIHAKNLSIRGRDSNVEWLLRIAEVEFDVSLTGLLRSRFEVSRVRGTGVAFWLRKRVDEREIRPEQVAGLPPIPGLRRVPVRPFRRCSEYTWDDATYHLWTIHLADVVAEDVRDVWVDDERFEGESRITGSFYLKPVRAVWVGPIEAEIRSALLRQGATAVLERAQGTARVMVSQFDPRTDKDPELRRLSLDLDGHATVPSLAHLPISSPSMRLAGAVHLSRLILHVKDGELQPVSRLEADTARWTISTGRHRATGSVSIEVRFGAEAGEPLRIEASFGNVEIDDRFARARRLTAVVRASPSTALADPVRFKRLEVDVDSDLRVETGGYEAVADERASFHICDWATRTKEMRLEGATWNLSGISVFRRGSTEPAMSIERVLVSADSPRVRLSDPLREASLSASLVDGRVRGGLRSRDFELGGRIDALANVSFSAPDRRARGGAQVTVSGATVDWRRVRATGDVRLIALVRESGPDPDYLDLSGSRVELRNVQVIHAKPEATQWAASASLQMARLKLRGGPELASRVTVDARNADALLGILVNSGLAKVFGLTHLPHLLAVAQLGVDGSRVGLRDIDARDGDVALRGSFGIRGGHRLGAFTLEKGALSVGLHVDDSGLGVRLFGLSGWLARQEGAVLRLLDGQGVTSQQPGNQGREQ